jgi:hypothetical protein
MCLVILLIAPRAAGPGFIKWDLALILIFGAFLVQLSPAKKSAIALISAILIFVLVTVQSPFVVVRELFSRFPTTMQLSSRIQDSEIALREIVSGGFPKPVATESDIALKESLKVYSGVVIANNNVYGPLGSLNVDHLPVPMLFGAFSPWLDNQNVSYLKSRKLDYVFLENNTAIDGNFWTTEAPATALYLFCNFAPASNSDTWLLLYKLPANRCENSSYATTQIIDEQNITLVDIETRFVLPGQHLFTDNDSFVLDIQGRRVGIQPKNSSGIMVHVPHSLDYPEPWNINGNLDLGRSERFNYRVMRLK